METTLETKVRLMIFTPSLECGGSEKFVSALCNNINTDLFTVWLVVLDNSKPFYRIKNPAVKVINLEKKVVRFSLPKLRSVVKEHQPDIIFTTANHLNLYFAIFRYLFPASVKFVARESSIVSVNNTRTRFPALYSRFIKRYYGRFDEIICQSYYMRQNLVANFNIRQEKTVVIHNSIEKSQTDNLSHTAYQEGKTCKFVTVARLSEEKGVERLIHAVGLLSMPFRFYIIGKGAKKPSLQKLIHKLHLEDKVFLEGEKESPFSKMEDADLFLMGSYYEGFPNVLLEAGDLGLPVVAFNVPGGIQEIISPANGILVDDNDIIGFAAAIKRGVAMNFNRKEIMEYTRSNFSVASAMRAIEDLFLRIK